MPPTSLSALKLRTRQQEGPQAPVHRGSRGLALGQPLPWVMGRGGEGAPETGSPLAHPWTRTDVGDGWAKGLGDGVGVGRCVAERDGNGAWRALKKLDRSPAPAARRQPQATPTPSVFDPRRDSSCPRCSQKPPIQGCAPGPHGYSSNRRASAPSFLSAFSTQDSISRSCSQKTGFFAFWE